MALGDMHRARMGRVYRQLTPDPQYGPSTESVILGALMAGGGGLASALISADKQAKLNKKAEETPVGGVHTEKSLTATEKRASDAAHDIGYIRSMSEPREQIDRPYDTYGMMGSNARDLHPSFKRGGNF
jgi:hypothetical protein